MMKAMNSFPSPEDSYLTLEVLHLRMATELCEMAGICKDVEDALGELLEQPSKPLESPVITFQGLDRLRQSLEDVARLSKFLSLNQGTGNQGSVPVDAIRNNIVLAGLAERLTVSSKDANVEIDSDQDIIWG